jgi:hypothetical protein
MLPDLAPKESPGFARQRSFATLALMKHKPVQPPLAASVLATALFFALLPFRHKNQRPFPVRPTSRLVLIARRITPTRLRLPIWSAAHSRELPLLRNTIYAGWPHLPQEVAC